MDLPNPGNEPGFPALQVDSLPTELSGKPLKQKTRSKFNIWFLSTSSHEREVEGVDLLLLCSEPLSSPSPHRDSQEMLLPQGLDTLGLHGFTRNPFPGPLHSWHLPTVQASASSLSSFKFYLFIIFACTGP